MSLGASHNMPNNVAPSLLYGLTPSTPMRTSVHLCSNLKDMHKRNHLTRYAANSGLFLGSSPTSKVVDNLMMA